MATDRSRACELALAIQAAVASVHAYAAASHANLRAEAEAAGDGVDSADEVALAARIDAAAAVKCAALEGEAVAVDAALEAFDTAGNSRLLSALPYAPQEPPEILFFPGNHSVSSVSPFSNRLGCVHAALEVHAADVEVCEIPAELPGRAGRFTVRIHGARLPVGTVAGKHALRSQLADLKARLSFVWGAASVRPMVELVCDPPARCVRVCLQVPPVDQGTGGVVLLDAVYVNGLPVACPRLPARIGLAAATHGPAYVLSAQAPPLH